jgi:hypothetical protein
MVVDQHVRYSHHHFLFLPYQSALPSITIIIGAYILMNTTMIVDVDVDVDV